MNPPQTSLHNARNITSRTQPTIPKINLDPDHPFFYHQLASSTSFVEIGAALEKTLPTFTLATLHFVVGSCNEFYALIFRNMDKVFSSDNSEEKAQVFIHLIKSINRLEHEIELGNGICTTTAEIKERLVLINNLKRQVDKLNSQEFFVDIDLSKQNLNYLDLRRLPIDLMRANFDGASVVKTNFSGIVLFDATFNDVDLSTTIGVPPTSISRSDGSYSDEPESAEAIVGTKVTCGKCTLF